MTTSELPSTEPSLPGVSGARAHLLGAHARVEEAAAAARRSCAVAWESPAADRFREDVGDLVAAVRSDLAAVEEAIGAAIGAVR